MRVLIVFPPYVSPWAPYLSLPALTAYLGGRAGVELIARDLNIEFFDYCTSDLSRKSDLRTDPIESVDWEAVSAAKAKIRSSIAFPWDEAILRQTLATIEEGMGAVSRRFGSTHLHLFAREHHSKSIALSLFPYGPFLGNYEMRYSPFSSEEVRAAVDDTSENPFLHFYEDRFIPYLQAIKPDFVGISVAFPQQHIPAFSLASLVKHSVPNAHVCIGGAQITKLGPSLKQSTAFRHLLLPLIDTTVLGEGEQALDQLIFALKNRVDLVEVPNLLFRRGRTSVMTGPGKTLSMATLPSPDFAQLPLDRYLNSGSFPSLPLQATRGCYWGKCAFCDSCSMFGPYRVRPEDQLHSDVEKIYEKSGIRGVQFADEALPPSIMRRLSQFIIERGLPMQWSSYARFDRALNPRLCELIAKGGCRVLFLGLEAGSSRVNRLMKKGVDVTHAREILEALRDAGVMAHLCAIVGFPGETLDEAQRTVDFLMENRHLYVSYILSPFMLEKNCCVARNPASFGITDLFEDPYNDLMTTYLYESVNGLSMDETASLYCSFNQQLAAAGAYNPIFS